MTTSLLSGSTLSNAPVTGNGQFELYNSGSIKNSTSASCLRVVVTYANNLPDPESVVVQYRLTAIVESSDGEGSWYPLHYQFQPFIKAEQGAKHILVLEPSIFSFDEGIPNTISDGATNIAVESKKQGRLSDDFRIRLLLSEGGYGTAGAFQSVDVTLHYEIYNS